jgi:hypothetical protein
MKRYSLIIHPVEQRGRSLGPRLLAEILLDSLFAVKIATFVALLPLLKALFMEGIALEHVQLAAEGQPSDAIVTDVAD